ncbi:dehydrogenase/reductase SDR family member on chromosome X-like isoform X2 [Artemia franciscana]|uniref:dehydrogenase/reductase SDR family member on chromosome X-like isoform X2 n=1 Tax=Artemia franciscana TaxID=6661 RepID=UPI0032DB6442
MFKEFYSHASLWVSGTKYCIKEGFSTQQKLTGLNEYTEGVAIVTGGNRGIGLETVKRLVEHGLKVIVGCRDGKSRDILKENLKEKNVPEEKVEWIELDTGNMKSVRQFAAKILEKNVPISILVNNAGVMFVPHSLTSDGFEQHFAVNYLGHFLLTHLLLPKMIESGKPGRAARIVNISSSAHKVGCIELDDLQLQKVYTAPIGYGQSKLAQVLFTFYLNKLISLRQGNVNVYAVHPGFIKTNLYDQAWYARFMVLTSNFMFKTPEQGAERSIYCALSPDAESLSGHYFENCKSTRALEIAYNEELQKNLFDKSCELLGIKEFL